MILRKIVHDSKRYVFTSDQQKRDCDVVITLKSNKFSAVDASFLDQVSLQRICCKKFLFSPDSNAVLDLRLALSLSHQQVDLELPISFLPAYLTQ